MHKKREKRGSPCTWVKPGRFGSFFALCFLALGGHCFQMLCLPGFGTHPNTQNLPDFRAFPASIQEHSPPKCLFFMASAKLPNRPGFALLQGHPRVGGGHPRFWAIPPVRLGLSGRNSGKIPERSRKRSQSFSWNSPCEYGWDPPRPIIQGIRRLESISRILSPPSTARDASFFRSGSPSIETIEYKRKTLDRRISVHIH